MILEPRLWCGLYIEVGCILEDAERVLINGFGVGNAAMMAVQAKALGCTYS